MRRLVYCHLLAAVILLAGCATEYPLNTELQLESSRQPGDIYAEGVAAGIKSRDSREDPGVIFYNHKDDEPVSITNITPPHLLVAEGLASGLRRQGLGVEEDSPLTLLVDVRELQATVTRPKMIYLTTARSSVTVKLADNGRTLSKKYNVESTRESLDKPEVDELEELLESQLSDIVEEILVDDAIREFIRQR